MGGCGDAKKDESFDDEEEWDGEGGVDMRWAGGVTDREGCSGECMRFCCGETDRD
jgi:hypothetical protein